MWRDVNTNGVQDSGEVGIANVTLTLLSGTTPLATTTTDGNGRYSFTDVDAPQFYLLEVQLSANAAAAATSPPTTLNPSQQLALNIPIP